MQKAFANFYATLLSWVGVHRPADFPVYKTQVFGSVGLLTIVLAVALVLVFYYVFNSLLQSNLYRSTHWLAVLLLAAGLGAWLAFGFSRGQGVERSQYLGYFMVLNAVLAALWFVVWSVLLKAKSTYARTTPFAWPRFAR